MTLTATVTITVDLIGDGWTLTPPSALGTPIVNANTPGDLFPIQTMAGNTALLIPQSALTIDYLFIDPAPQNSGSMFTLKGLPADVGVGISSMNPSLIPVATTAIIPQFTASITLTFTEIWLQSTSATQLNIGWI